MAKKEFCHSRNALSLERCGQLEDAALFMEVGLEIVVLFMEVSLEDVARFIVRLRVCSYVHGGWFRGCS